MKNSIKKDSEQAIKDKASVIVLQDERATARAKDEAFSLLYSRYNQQVRFYFLERMKDSDVAEDLLIVTFQKIHENINTYDANIGAFSTWMYKIARNTLIDHSRKAKFEVLSLDALHSKTSDGMEFQIDSGGETPQDLMVREEIKKEVYDAVYSIKSKRTRDLIILRYIEGMSFKEISEKLGVELNSTLRTDVRRGKGILKKKLARFENNIS